MEEEKIGTQIFFGTQIFLGTQIFFGTQIFLGPKFFSRTQIFFGTLILTPTHPRLNPNPTPTQLIVELECGTANPACYSLPLIDYHLLCD